MGGGEWGEPKKKCFLSNVLQIGLIESSFLYFICLRAQQPLLFLSLISEPPVGSVMKTERADPAP